MSKPWKSPSTNVRRCGLNARFITYLSRKHLSQCGAAPQLRYKDTIKPVRTDVYITIIPWARVGYEAIKYWTNERVARVGYNRFISNKGEWNNCFSKFSNRVLLPIFIFTILQSGKFLNLAHYFPDDVKLRLLAHSKSFLANQKARNAIVGAENLLIHNIV